VFGVLAIVGVKAVSFSFLQRRKAESFCLPEGVVGLMHAFEAVLLWLKLRPKLSAAAATASCPAGERLVTSLRSMALMRLKRVE